MNTNANTADYVSAMTNLRFPGIVGDGAQIGNRTYSGPLLPRAYYDPFERQLYHGGVFSESARTAERNSKTASEDGDDVGCMLRDPGEDCPSCGAWCEEQKPEKFGGPGKERRLGISRASGALFDGISFPASAFDGWIPGLGHSNSARTSPPAPADSVGAVPDVCGSCGTDASALKINGPGHCVECRYRWLGQYRAEQASKAGVTAPRLRKAEVDVLRKKHAR